MKYFYSVIFLFIQSLLVSVIVDAQSESYLSTRSEIRNEILLWNTPGLEIKGDTGLCFLLHKEYRLVRHVVASCDELFSNVTDRLLDKGLEASTDEGASFLVTGLSRYLNHLLHELVRANSGATVSDPEMISEAQKILLILLRINQKHPEYFTDARVEQIFRGNREAFYLLFFGYQPNSHAGEIAELISDREIFLRNELSGILLLNILSFQYGTAGVSYVNGADTRRYFTDLSIPLLKYISGRATPDFQNDILLPEEKHGVFTGFPVKEFVYLLSFLGLLMAGGFLFRIFPFFRSSVTDRTAYRNSDTDFLTSEERAELRELRKFFSLRPAEGTGSLHGRYRTFVRKLHPDVVRDNGESFISLQERYQRARTLLARLEVEKMQRLANDS
jgi:hypothetical protein